MVYIFIDIAQVHCKIAAEDNINTYTSLKTIKVPKIEFLSKKENKEIWIMGKLYDVSSYIIVDDTAIVSVFHDEQEENLVNTIAGLFDQKDAYAPASDGQLHLFKYRLQITFDGVEPIHYCYLNCFKNFPHCKMQSYWTENISSSVQNIIIPPPKIG